MGTIKDHRKVRESIAIGKPIIEHKPSNSSSYSIRCISHKIAGLKEPKRTIIDSMKGFIDDIR